jgi:hypothetical protein
MDKVFALIEKYREPDGSFREGHFSPAEDEAFIQHAETVLGHALPDDDRRFVTTYRAGFLFGLEIYGVLRNRSGAPDFSPGVPDAVGLTLEARREHGLDSSTLCISRLGDGVEVHLDMDGGGVYSWLPENLRSTQDDSPRSPISPVTPRTGQSSPIDFAVS